VVSHEMSFVRDVADRVAFMHGSRVLEVGSPAKIFDRPATAQLKTFVGRFRGISAKLSNEDAPAMDGAA